MTELERAVHAAVAKAFTDFRETEARVRAVRMAPDAVARRATYEALWDKAITHALDSMTRKEERP